MIWIPMQGVVFPGPKNRLFLWTFLVIVSLISAAYFLGNAFSAKLEYKQVCILFYSISFSLISFQFWSLTYYYYLQRLARWGLIYSMPPDTNSNACKVCLFVCFRGGVTDLDLTWLGLISSLLGTMPSFWYSTTASRNSCYNF